VSAEKLSMEVAVSRLEAAVVALGAAVSRPRPAPVEAAPTLPEDMVPKAEVAALSARLDAALVALHAALVPDPALVGEEE